MRGLSQGRSQNVGSYEQRIIGRAQRSIEGDRGSGNGPKWPRISLKKV